MLAFTGQELGRQTAVLVAGEDKEQVRGAIEIRDDEGVFAEVAVLHEADCTTFGAAERGTGEVKGGGGGCRAGDDECAGQLKLFLERVDVLFEGVDVFLGDGREMLEEGFKVADVGGEFSADGEEFTLESHSDVTDAVVFGVAASESDG